MAIGRSGMMAAPRLAQQGRRIRRPEHKWNTIQNPWAITPFLIAPVIPGETMRSAVLQARAISKPIKDDLLGWWCEHYLFYVKLSDLNVFDTGSEGETMRDMFTDVEWAVPAALQDNTANADYYFNGRNRINYVKHCLQRVTEEYFRDEGEAWDIATYEGLPLAKTHYKGVFDSLMSQDDYQVPLDIDADLDADGTTTIREIEEGYRRWEMLRQANLTEATYEDFIRSFGVQGNLGDQVNPRRPELIRYEKSWTYPANTVEVSGIRSVASWSLNLRADKDRLFKEPGFIFGVTVARPKVYLTNQTAAAVNLLDHVTTWLPAVLSGDPASSLLHVPDGTGPIGTDPVGYYVDIRDLFVYGDQFVNHALYANGVALPKATNLDKEYVAAADIEGLFVGATAADRVIRQDGIATFMIASANATDYTARTGASVDVT